MKARSQLTFVAYGSDGRLLYICPEESSAILTEPVRHKRDLGDFQSLWLG
jgi:hypothetical protein